MIKSKKINIIKYDFDGNIVNTYNSLYEISDKADVKYNIYNCCIGVMNSAYGYVWRFEGDRFDKYFQKYSICHSNDGRSRIVNYDKLKYSNIPIYQYNPDGSLNAIYDDIYCIPDYNGKNITHILECLNGVLNIYNGFIYRYNRDLDIEKNGYSFHNDSTSKKVKQYSLDGTLINTYNSLISAKKETGASNIGECCRGNRRKSGGFVWRYENDPFDLYPIERKISCKTKKYENIPVYQYNMSGKLINKYKDIYEFPCNDRSNIIKCLNKEIKHYKNYCYSYKEEEIQSDGIYAQYDYNDNLIGIYSTLKEAKKATGATHISDCIAGKVHSSGGYKWIKIYNQKKELKCSNKK